MTPRRYLILSVVILCAVVSAQQAVFWRSDAARTEASQRLDAARVRLQGLAGELSVQALPEVERVLVRPVQVPTLSTP